MTIEYRKKHGWLGALFEPTVDFYELLSRQACKTLEGIEALESWLVDGAYERCQQVRDLEKEADELKFDLEKNLVNTFVTPFDREDIYDLSAQCDEIINAAKSTVREIEALQVSKEDPYMAPMAEMLVEGTRCIVLSFESLRNDPREAANQAALARKSENRIAKIYRQAMRQLFAEDDLKRILKTCEVYRHMMQAAKKVDLVGERLLHVIIKMS